MLTSTRVTPAPTDALAALPDPGFLAVALAQAAGILQEEDGELHAADFPDCWREGLPAALANLWSHLFELTGWHPVRGGQPEPAPGNPYPAAYLASLALLTEIPKQAWIAAGARV